MKNSMMLLGSTAEEPKFLPKVFVVNGKCYWFLNVARRAAFGTEHPIEVMTIRDAWEIHLHVLPTRSRRCVELRPDRQHVHGQLFATTARSWLAWLPNPVIKMMDGKPDRAAMADMEDQPSLP